MEREQLVAALARGDEQAWQEFLRDYGRVIHAAIARFATVRHEREDLFQNAVVAVHRSIGSLQDPEKLASWLFSLTYRLTIDHLRRRPRDPAAAPQDLEVQALFLSDEGPPPDDELHRVQEAALMRDLVDRLGGRCRTVILALYLEDPPLGYQELAEREGIPVGSIGPTRARCLEKLRGLLPDVSAHP